MLCRIYATAFPHWKAAPEHLDRIEEAKSATTASWAANWICSTSLTRARRFPFFFPKGHDFAQHPGGLLARDPSQGRV